MVCPLNKVAKMAKQSLEEYNKARPIPQKKVKAQRPSWKPSDRGNIKTNFDGAMFEDINSPGICVVVHDDKGEVLAALAKRIHMPESVLVLETLAARRADSEFNL